MKRRRGGDRHHTGEEMLSGWFLIFISGSSSEIIFRGQRLSSRAIRVRAPTVTQEEDMKECCFLVCSLPYAHLVCFCRSALPEKVNEWIWEKRWQVFLWRQNSFHLILLRTFGPYAEGDKFGGHQHQCCISISGGSAVDELIPQEFLKITHFNFLKSIQ